MQQLCFRVTWKTDQSTQSFLFDKTLILTLPPTWNWGSAFDPPPLSRYFSFSKNVYFWHKCVLTSFWVWGFLDDIKVFCPSSSRSVDGDMSCTVTWCQLICGIDIKWFWIISDKIMRMKPRYHSTLLFDVNLDNFQGCLDSRLNLSFGTQLPSEICWTHHDVTSLNSYQFRHPDFWKIPWVFSITIRKGKE